MNSSPVPVSIAETSSARDWRQDSRVEDFLTHFVSGTTADHPLADSTVRRFVRSLLRSNLYFSAGRTGHAVMRLGVSASHELGRTYVAAATSPVTIDACALNRWREVSSTGRVAFREEEVRVLHSAWDWVRAWTLLECQVKAARARILSPGRRAPLVKRCGGGTSRFVSGNFFRHDSSGPAHEVAVCVLTDDSLGIIQAYPAHPSGTSVG